MTNNTENKKQESIDKTDDINTENNKELDENLEQQNENDTFNKDKFNKDIKLHIAIATVSLSLIVAGVSAAFIKHNRNNNIDDELPSFTMENGELSLGELTEDTVEDKDENIEYTFSNLPQEITNVKEFLEVIDVDYKNIDSYLTDPENNYLGGSRETENGEFIELISDKDSDNIRVLKYNQTGEILKNFVLNYNADNEFFYEAIEVGDNLLITKDYPNSNNTFTTEMLLFNSKGTLLKSEKLTPNLYIDNLHYSKDMDRILIVYSDLRELNYISQYDTSLNKINQFKIGKGIYNTNIFTNKECITIFSELSTYNNKKQDEYITTINMDRYDYNGNSLLHKKIMSPGDITIHDIKKSNDKGFILTLSEFYEENENTISSSQFFVKVDNKGNIVWQIKNPNRLDFYEAYELEDGILVPTSSEFISNEDKEVSKPIPTLIKYDYSGKEIWRKYSLHISEDNNSFEIPGYYDIIEGTVKDNEIEFYGNYINNNKEFVIFKLKVNSDGEFIKY